MLYSSDFLPNYLDQYNLTTYHIKFYMLSQGRPCDFDAIDPANGAIIAETGVTGQVTIEDMSVMVFTPSSLNSGKSEAQKVTFTLKEHNGASLIDKMRSVGRDLGLDSIVNSVYYIELTFLANQEPNASEPFRLPFAYRWPIMLTSMDATVLASGTTYEMVGYHLAGQAAISTLVGTNSNGPVVVDMGAPSMSTESYSSTTAGGTSATANTSVFASKVPPAAKSVDFSKEVATKAASSAESFYTAYPAKSALSFTTDAASSAAKSLLSASQLAATSRKNNASTYMTDAEAEWGRPPGSDWVLPPQDGISNAETSVLKENSKQPRLPAEVAKKPLGKLTIYPNAMLGNTVGSALRFLAAILTERSKDSYDASYTTYIITADPEIANMRLQTDPSVSAGRTKTTIENKEGWVYSFPPDLSVTAMIERIILSSPDYQTKSVNGSVPDGKTTAADQLSNFFKIDVDPRGPNGAILPMSTATPERLYLHVGIYKMSAIGTLADTKSTPEGVAQATSNEGLLNKRYNYLFTGQNDQVLNLDIKFKLEWFVGAPNNEGRYNDTGSTTYGETAYISPFIIDQKLRIQQQTDQFKAKEFQDPYTLRAQADIIKGVRTGAANFQKLLASTQSSINEQLGISEEVKNEAEQKKAELSRRDTEYKALQIKSKVRYVESAYAYKPADITFKSQSNITSTDGSRAASPGVEPPKGIGRGYANSLFSNAFNARSGDLSNIEMKIKGDPYWLGLGYSANIALPQGAGRPCFVLTIKDQTLYNTATGLAQPSGEANGLYIVTTVLSEFSGGTFTQVLYGKIDPKAQNLRI